MKSLQEIRASGKVLVGQVGADGGMGEIHLNKWTGSVIWSYGGGWEHVSVSPYKKHITPSWDDMCKIKELFYKDEECVVQYHPPKTEYVNLQTNCLHLWRPINQELPAPPSIMVGPRKGQTAASMKEEAREVLANG